MKNKKKELEFDLNKIIAKKTKLYTKEFLHYFLTEIRSRAEFPEVFALREIFMNTITSIFISSFSSFIIVEDEKEEIDRFYNHILENIDMTYKEVLKEKGFIKEQ